MSNVLRSRKGTWKVCLYNEEKISDVYTLVKIGKFFKGIMLFVHCSLL